MSNCYKCKHRGTLIDDRHSKCCHPLVEAICNNEIIQIIGIAPKRADLLQKTTSYAMAKIVGVELNEHGVANGWAFWPISFDPIWIESCKLYEEKEDEQQEEETSKEDF